MVVVSVTSSVIGGRRKNKYDFVIQKKFEVPNWLTGSASDDGKQKETKIDDEGKKKENAQNDGKKSAVDDNLQCGGCKSQFLNENFLELHRQKCKGQKRISGAKINVEKRPNEPNQSNTKRQVFKCKICPETFYLKSLLQKHKMRHKKEKFKCHPCDKIFITKIGLTQHNDKNHNLRCEVCSAKCSTRKVLDLHMARLHTNKKEALEKEEKHNKEADEKEKSVSPNSCKECSDEFYWPDPLHICKRPAIRNLGF